MTIMISGTADVTVTDADISNIPVPTGVLASKPIGGWSGNRGMHELAVECGKATLHFVGTPAQIEALEKAMIWLLECDEEPEEDEDEPEDPLDHAAMQEMADDDRAHAFRERWAE